MAFLYSISVSLGAKSGSRTFSISNPVFHRILKTLSSREMLLPLDVLFLLIRTFWVLLPLDSWNFWSPWPSGSWLAHLVFLFYFQQNFLEWASVFLEENLLHNTFFLISLFFFFFKKTHDIYIPTLAFPLLVLTCYILVHTFISTFL